MPGIDSGRYRLSPFRLGHDPKIGPRRFPALRIELLRLVVGYGFAWIGHFFFEKNRPATFEHPLYSLAGDWVMFWAILRRRVSL